MIIRLIKKTKIYNFSLPTKVVGNYWVTDNDRLGNNRNLINVEAEDGKWKIKSDFETKIMSASEELEYAYLKENSIYYLKINNENEFVILYCSPSLDEKVSKLQLNRNGDIIIGNDQQCHISYNHPLVSKQHAKLSFSNGKWRIEDLTSKYGTYVNNYAISSASLEYGDIIFIMGLKIIVMPDFIVLNHIENQISFDGNTFALKNKIIQKKIKDEEKEEDQLEFYSENDYFFRSPRFKSKIEAINVTVEDPPAKEKPNEMPMIYVVGPMLTMAMSSLAFGYTSLSGVIKGEQPLSSALPTLIMSFAMLLTMLLWPLLSDRYQKKQVKKRENLRQEKYRKYVEEKHQEIVSAMGVQRQILIDNYQPLDYVKNIIENKKRNLWEREIKQEDFLDLRLGIGSTELVGNVQFPEKKFMLEEDDLRDFVYKVASESRLLVDVPISLSFIKNYVTAIIGEGKQKQKFIEGLILQMVAFHSYEDLKIVLFTNQKNSTMWDYLKILPHTWNNDKTMRYYATNLDEMKEISLYLEQEFQHRNASSDNIHSEDRNYLNYEPYYVMITDDYKVVRDLEIIKDVASQEINLGFSLIINSPRLTNLPNECKTFISIGDQKSGVFENELVSNKQKEFVADYDENLNIYQLCQILANIPIDIEKEEKNIPDSVSFLEMYNVGTIEQLNILNRWKTSDPTKSLQVPIGLDKNGEQFKLDLHEKFYGPHGLIAGMTGSGKSELIISYILSMAVNFSPMEASFVLIDYKGGGLAGVFQNKETGYQLPHLAGTITNLDTIEMNRALSSIQSELRRRQRKFNEARDKLNESTIDIYKYQRLYREGKVDEAISHLFIISDEFAELKDQQPDFMDQLISTARIGRSLGVHLILATQKPAGVVDDQIWSNSKFKICLKVQDRSDSMDMIKCPDAAALKNPGRFYLQVGYNELFALGQSAWCGAQYYPTEKRKKKVDTSLEFIDNVGTTIRSLDVDSNKIPLKSEGEELPNIVKYIVDVANSEDISIPNLWLERIPDIIYTEDLKRKYHYQIKENQVEVIIGEYDDPDNQRQDIFTLNLSEDGNSIVFGSTGSGKELLLSSLIYSAITNYLPSEVNFYILDFGAETLKMFDKAPQVGAVLTVNDTEKIENLFKMIHVMMEERKKIFADYNGSYLFYLEHAKERIPLISVIINNYEAFMETYDDYEDEIIQLSREGLKYGISFILSTSSTNAIRYRVRQNFKKNIILQLNDASDYSDVLQTRTKKEPSKALGRGLIELDNVYEFQTSYCYDMPKMADFIKVISQKLRKICKTSAQKIPVLPDVVSIEDVEEQIGNIKTIPVGIVKKDLSVATFDFKNNQVSMICANDITPYKEFYKMLLKLFSKVPYQRVIVVDALKLFDTGEIENNYINTNFDSMVSMIKNTLEKEKQVYNSHDEDKAALEKMTKTTYLMIGFSNFLSKIEEQNKQLFTDLLQEFKEYSLDNFVMVDYSEKIKSFAYDNWYKTSVDSLQGIWLGNGISEQYAIKLVSTPRELREEIPEQFAYVIKNGKATLIKYIEE